MIIHSHGNEFVIRNISFEVLKLYFFFRTATTTTRAPCKCCNITQPTTTTIPTTYTTTSAPNTESTTANPINTTYNDDLDGPDVGIVCYRGLPSRLFNSSRVQDEIVVNGRYSQYLNDDRINLYRPAFSFDFLESESETEVEIVFDAHDYEGVVLIYYPGFLDASNLDSETSINSINCRTVISTSIVIKNLLPSTVYTFCALFGYTVILTPFQCKSYQTLTPFRRQTWIYQEQKVIILTSFLMLLLISLLVGVITTYLLIRRMPTLMRGSKRVVMVNNETKDVMVLSSGSRNNSLQKETPKPIKNEAPTYLTPRPRESFDHR